MAKREMIRVDFRNCFFHSRYQNVVLNALALKTYFKDTLHINEKSANFLSQLELHIHSIS